MTFIEHLEQCSRIVATWPEEIQEILGGSVQRATVRNDEQEEGPGPLETLGEAADVEADAAEVADETRNERVRGMRIYTKRVSACSQCPGLRVRLYEPGPCKCMETTPERLIDDVLSIPSWCPLPEEEKP